MRLSEKVCLITNIGELQGHPTLPTSSVRVPCSRFRPSTSRAPARVNNNAPPHIDKPLYEIGDDEWRGMVHRIVDELSYTTRRRCGT